LGSYPEGIGSNPICATISLGVKIMASLQEYSSMGERGPPNPEVVRSKLATPANLFHKFQHLVGFNKCLIVTCVDQHNDKWIGFKCLVCGQIDDKHILQKPIDFEIDVFDEEESELNNIVPPSDEDFT
jgi:hypothetical protein